MKTKVILLKAFLCSTLLVLTIRWIIASDVQRFLNVTYPPSTTPTKTPLPIMRQSVILSDGKYNYHLNLTSFEAEFPHLQRYNCTIIHEPHPEEQGAPNQKLLILAVKSHPSTGARRAALRQTWAREMDVNGYRLRPIFLMGNTDVRGHMETVKEESKAYGDILQWDMTEGHHNLSLKERCFLEWIYLNLPNVHFIFKGDDDEFVNPHVLTQYISEHGTPNTVHGSHQRRPPAMRWSKYSISKTLYPQEYYPGFVSGGGFLFPGAAVKSLYAASQLLPVFPLDDVYFGFLALAANLTIRHDHRFHVYGLIFNACRFKKALVVHGIDSEDMGQIWQKVQNSECNNQSAPS